MPATKSPSRALRGKFGLLRPHDQRHVVGTDDFLIGPADPVAVLPQDAEPPGNGRRIARDVAPPRVLGDQAQRHRLATAPDHDRSTPTRDRLLTASPRAPLSSPRALPPRGPLPGPRLHPPAGRHRRVGPHTSAVHAGRPWRCTGSGDAGPECCPRSAVQKRSLAPSTFERRPASMLCAAHVPLEG